MQIAQADPAVVFFFGGGDAGDQSCLLAMPIYMNHASFEKNMENLTEADILDVQGTFMCFMHENGSKSILDAQAFNSMRIDILVLIRKNIRFVTSKNAKKIFLPHL